jgi:hypothetical protein
VPIELPLCKGLYFFFCLWNGYEVNDTVVKDFEIISKLSKRIGLEVNTCKIVSRKQIFWEVTFKMFQTLHTFQTTIRNVKWDSK